MNIELPSQQGLQTLAPDKSREAILRPMGLIRDGTAQSKAELAKYRHAPVFARAEPAPYAAGGAGRVVFGCVRQDRQLVQKLHVLLRRAAATAGRRLIDAVDEPHNVGGDGAGAQQGDDKT